MISTTWKRAKQVFHEALEKSGPERSGFVASACGEDRELHAQVQALLAAHDEAGEFMASPTMTETNEATRAATTLRTSPPAERPGATIGHYKLLQVIGEGGFGVVYMAEQKEPVRRRVALKIIKLGMDTKQVIARFEAERQALALMEHPNIARVFDAGATETGRPYFVMELVKGVPITEYCDSNRLTTRERLDLFTEICGAVQHAHQKGIIHRDIKPSNVLVTLHDGKPVPKVIDFGIAKATHQRLTEKTLFTEYGQFIGTPVYMSPEQAEMSGLDIDTRSDIYSLGVLLYELLTGTTPFDLESLRGAGFAEMQRMIREEEPPRPSTRISTLGGAITDIAKHRKTDPGGLSRLVRGDLDWIVMKALEKDRTRRYASASEFAVDVARHLVDEPVIARPPSAAYKFGKYVRKHKGPVIAVAAVVATALILGSVAFRQGLLAQRRAIQVRGASILVAAEATDDPLTKALLLDEVAEQTGLPGRLRIAREVADAPLPLAVLRGHENYLLDVEISPDSTRAVTASADGTARVWRLDGTGRPVVLRGHEGGVFAARFSPDGRSVLTASHDGTARLWRADGSGDPIVFIGHQNWVRSAVFSPDASLILTASNDGTARIWRADGSGEPLVLRGHESPTVRQAVFSPDGRLVATACEDRTARIWRTDGAGEPRILRHDVGVWSVMFSPDGERLLTQTNKAAHVWRTEGAGDPIVLRQEGRVISATFSPDGRRVLTATGKGWRVWRADGTGEPVVLDGPGGQAAIFSPDGKQVIAASWDGSGRVWSEGSLQPVLLGRHDGGLDDVAVSPDGTRVVTASHDGTARVWALDARGETVVLRGHEDELESVAFSSDGSKLVTTSIDGTTRIWPADGRGEPVVFVGDVAALSPDGSRVVIGSSDGVARIWPTEGSGEAIELKGHEGSVWSAAFSPDGSRLVTGSQDGTARLWRADGTEEPVVFEAHPAGVARVAFSPDGGRVLATSLDGSVRIWSVDGTKDSIVLPGPEQEVLESGARIFDDPGPGRRVNVYWDDSSRIWRDRSTDEPTVVAGPGHGIALLKAYWTPEIAISPDARRVLVVETGTLWRVDGEVEPSVLPDQQGLVNAVFSPDGRLLVGVNGGVRVWRTGALDEPTVLRGHTSEVYHAAFSSDGSRVVTGSYDGTARVWDISGKEEPIVLHGRGAVIRVAFSPDGERVAAASWDGVARVWRVTWSGLLAHIRNNLHACLTLQQRRKFLAESAPEAREAYATCERRQGREPVVVEGF